MTFLSNMDYQVCLETVSPCELFLTFVTGMWSVSSMNKPMSLQITGLCKLFATDICILFLSCMDDQMFLEIAGMCKPLLTYLTRVECHSSMNIHMTIEIAGL